MKNETEISSAELTIENRQLRRALHTLLDELESEGTPDMSRVRELIPAPIEPGLNGIQPPWERDGFESKQSWLNDLGAE